MGPELPRGSGAWYRFQIWKRYQAPDLPNSPASAQVRLSAARLQLLPPLHRFILLVPGVVELHQPLQRLGQACLDVRRDLGRALLQPVVTLQEQRLGLGVLLLAQEAPAELRPGIEGRPGVRLDLFPDGEALAQ